MADLDDLTPPAGGNGSGAAVKIGGYEFSSKNLIVIGLIGVGLFFAYVIFLKPKPAAATTPQQSGGGGVPTTSDPSAVGSLQTGIESLQAAAAAQNQQLAAANTAIAGQGGTLATINRNADSAARDASGARSNSSIALNGVNQLLGKGDSIGGATYADYWHLANSGLGA